MLNPHQRFLCRIGHHSLFRPETPSIPRDIPDNLRQILCIRDNVHVSQHLQVRKVVGDALLLEGGDEGVVCVEVRYDLEAALEGDDLAF